MVIHLNLSSLYHQFSSPNLLFSLSQRQWFVMEQDKMIVQFLSPFPTTQKVCGIFVFFRFLSLKTLCSRCSPALLLLLFCLRGFRLGLIAQNIFICQRDYDSLNLGGIKQNPFQFCRMFFLHTSLWSKMVQNF